MILEPPVKLSISCVYFDTEEGVFEKTVESLALSIDYAKKNGLKIEAELHLINNNSIHDQWFIAKSRSYEPRFDKLVSHTGQGNIGYGRGNNLAILSTKSDFHLVLNPDVFLAEDNIFNAICHMQINPELDALAADAFDSKNNRLYLAKREPSISVLLARAINSKWLNKLFHKQLERYEYRDSYTDQPKMMNIELMSGCYMFIRTLKLQSLGGFDERYFLYFEDFELSRRLQKKVLFFNVRIVHLGGNAARKKAKHLFMFSWSMLKFLYFLK